MTRFRFKWFIAAASAIFIVLPAAVQAAQIALPANAEGVNIIADGQRLKDVPRQAPFIQDGTVFIPMPANSDNDSYAWKSSVTFGNVDVAYFSWITDTRFVEFDNYSINLELVCGDLETQSGDLEDIKQAGYVDNNTGKAVTTIQPNYALIDIYDNTGNYIFYKYYGLDQSLISVKGYPYMPLDVIMTNFGYQMSGWDKGTQTVTYKKVFDVQDIAKGILPDQLKPMPLQKGNSAAPGISPFPGGDDGEDVLPGRLTPVPAQEDKPAAQSTPTSLNVIAVTVNGKPVLFPDQQPMIQNGRTLVPVRGLADALGASVGWDAAAQTVTAAKDGAEVELVINSTTAKLNGRDVTLDAAPAIVNGRTMLPARFIAEAFGAAVDWDAYTQTVIITNR